MKFIVFRSGKSRNKSRNIPVNFGLNFERMLFLSFICIFLALIIVQGAMINPSQRIILFEDNKFEGRPLQLEEYLYDEGEISVALCDSYKNEDIKVLINGEEVAAFTDNIIALKVKDMDIVEIDGSLAEGAEIKVVSTSSNISGGHEGRILILDKSVKQLMTVMIENKE